MFVQIGNKAFNPNHITEVYFEPNGIANTVALFFDVRDTDSDQVYMEFDGDEYESFLEWWELKAEVDRR